MRRRKRSIQEVLKAIALWLLQGVVSALIVLFFIILFVEWVSGCGESYVDSKGVTHVGKCVILPERS